MVLDREASIGRSLVMRFDIVLTMADISVVLNLEVATDVRFLRGVEHPTRG